MVPFGKIMLYYTVPWSEQECTCWLSAAGTAEDMWVIGQHEVSCMSALGSGKY